LHSVGPRRSPAGAFVGSTPGFCLRRESAPTDWIPNHGRGKHGHGKVYFRRVAEWNNWPPSKRGIVELREVLCRAGADPSGGLHRGDL
jgi:hypothetical protein